jgi:GGDEF domain-containing protein
MVDALESDERPQVFVHFDFDNFKPFNDRFGFRQGDRAITMFADLMRRRLAAGDVFLGHIGGDDFFLGAHGEAVLPVIDSLPAFIAQFASDMASFYDPEARRSGTIEATDRNGTVQFVPLLSVSCGRAIVGETSGRVNLDALSAMLADLKKRAKRSTEIIAIDDFTDWKLFCREGQRERPWRAEGRLPCSFNRILALAANAKRRSTFTARSSAARS